MNEYLRVKNLQVPQGNVDVVLDTDAYNEIDDQYAIAYLLKSKEKLNTLYSSLDAFLLQWKKAERKQIIIDQMEKVGIKIDELLNHYPEKFQSRDVFDIIVNVAFNEPMLYRSERAKRIQEKNFLEKFLKSC